MNEKAFDYSGYYLISLGDLSSDRFDVAAKILHDCWSLYMVNSNVIVLNDNENDAAIYTYFPFTSHHCEKVVPVVIDNNVNRNQALTASQYFVDKTANLYGCPVSVAPTIYPPYTMLRNISDRLEFHGIDANLIYALGERMNYSLIVRPLPRMDYVESSKIALDMVCHIHVV